jgi:RimJ/RimL family protein N-acetyltransferase
VLPADAFRDKPTLTGDRVVLRPLGPEHADAMLASTRDPELRRLTGTHTEFDRDTIERWVGSRGEHVDRLDLAIHRRDDDAFLGELALTGFEPADEVVAIRIALASTGLRGQGYGSEAMALVLDYAFDVVGVHRVELDVYAYNEGAIRAYERLGFVHEGRLREVLLWDGERHDALVMSLLRPEWEAAR